MSDPGQPPVEPAAGPPALPVPGWYPDPVGQMRWWDGTQWGVVATTGAAPVSDPRQMAMLAHLLGMVIGFIGPLIIYATAGNKDPFVRHHAAEALNFQITVFAAAMVCAALMCVLIGFLLFPFLIIGIYVFQIQGCIAANRGQWWRYPINIRLVSGAVGA